MLFSSTVFIYLFLPLVLIGYYGIFRKSRKAQNVFLLIASLFFYAWGEPGFVLVMMASIFANWVFALLVCRAKKSGRTGIARAVVALACVYNLSFLFVFKYLNFATSIIAKAYPTALITKIALPIGISFFTFQAMSYVLDVYRDRGSVQKNILNVGLYISFFPQLIAGPIVRYETVADEINNRKENTEDFFSGFCRFVTGLAKKVLLANSFALLADKVFYFSTEGGITAPLAWLGAIGYTLQIFFDFSGYSDMAIGLGKMFGFHFLENFNYPYISKSITEFWRRWHISLGSWFRDYVYFPLGGSRVNSKLRLVFNLFVVWLLTGIWHGADWTFIVWGLMYFVLIALEKLIGIRSPKNKLQSVICHIYTMFFVIMGWVIFRADDMPRAMLYISQMFDFSKGRLFGEYFSRYAVMLAVGIFASLPLARRWGERIANAKAGKVLLGIWIVLLFVLSIASLLGSSYNPFIYFNF